MIAGLVPPFRETPREEVEGGSRLRLLLAGGVHAYFTQECPALCHDLESLRWLTFGGELEDVLSFRTD